MTALEFADVTWAVWLAGLLLALFSDDWGRRCGVALLAFWAGMLVILAVARG